MARTSDDDRLAALVDLIVQLASGDLRSRLEPSPAGDSIDAVVTGINLLAEELDLIHRTLEQRVEERTLALEQARREMEHRALTDGLTGLANRTLLGQQMDHALSQMNAGSAPPFVLLLDLDEFKTINDGLGHSAGDQVLKEVARRLRSVVRGTDTVARLGGDEFAILMPGVAEAEALAIAQRALRELQKPFELEDRPVWAGASMGLCQGTLGQTGELMLRDADIAMYVAKGKGRGNIQTFRPEMHQAASERLRVESELGAAITAGELVLYYQPIVDIGTDVLVGAEALVRWNHPKRGLLAPAQFIAVAEASGHIVELGRWVVEAAIAQLASWRALLVDSVFQLHVNLSPVEVRWPGLADFLQKALFRYDVSPSRLALEISETGLMTGDAAGLETLGRIKRMGVGIEIDDFGTGYSSISYLRRLPIDTVKVDQSLIREITKDTQQAHFVGAILRLIESAGLRTVVEGIETQTQLDELRKLGCTYGQGYLLSRPVTAKAMTHMLQAERQKRGGR